MSILSIIDHSNEFRAWMKGYAPKKSNFHSFSDYPAFSKKVPSLMAVTNDEAASAITGTAADYMFRFMIASNVSNHKEDSLTGLLAFNGLKAVRRRMHSENNISDYGDLSIQSQKLKIFINRLFLKYDSSISAIKSYVYHQNDDIVNIASICVWFAYLEHYYRSSGVSEAYDAVIRYDEIDHGKQIEKVLNYASIFNTNFIQKGFVRENSIVIYNPDFGEYSIKVGGADGDVFIDGVLYDFKAVKENGYRFRNIAQIFSYYLLYVLDCRHDHTSRISGYEVTRLAFYYANYGQVYYAECNEFTYDFEIVIQEFEEIVEDINRSVLYDRMLSERFFGDVKRYFPVFNDKLLDRSVFGASDIDEYLSLACPVYTSMPVNLCDLTPIPWENNEIPKAALDSGIYFINIECHFTLKEGKTPFIISKRGFMYPKYTPLKTSFIESKGKLCGYYKDLDGTIKMACPELYLYSNDFKKFLETYNVVNLRIKTGIYFAAKE